MGIWEGPRQDENTPKKVYKATYTGSKPQSLSAPVSGTPGVWNSSHEFEQESPSQACATGAPVIQTDCTTSCPIKLDAACVYYHFDRPIDTNLLGCLTPSTTPYTLESIIDNLAILMTENVCNPPVLSCYRELDPNLPETPKIAELTLSIQDMICLIRSDSEFGGRFAIEDNRGLQNRSIDMEGYSFDLYGATFGFTLDGSKASLLYVDSTFQSSMDLSPAGSRLIASDLTSNSTTAFYVQVNKMFVRRTISGTAGYDLDFPDFPLGQTYIPYSVNGQYADINGNIVINTTSAQNLQQVTDIGNVTTNSIQTAAIQVDGDVPNVLTLTQSGTLGGGFGGTISFKSITDNTYVALTAPQTSSINYQSILLPNGTGTLALSVNGIPADAFGDIPLGTGSRFGIEDNIATGNRSFDLSGHAFNYNSGSIKLTTGSIDLEGGSISAYDAGFSNIAALDGTTGTIYIKTSGGTNANIKATNLSTIDRILELPNNSGTLALSVNGIFANAAGNIVISSGGGGTYTVNNGLTETPTGNFQFGGTLLANTTLAANTFQLNFTGSNSLYTARFNNTGSGSAVNINNTGTGAGLIVNTTGNASAFFGTSHTSGTGVSISNTGNTSLNMVRTNVSANDVVTSINIVRITSATALNGMGSSIDFNIGTSNNNRLSNQIISKWTDATDASRVSQFIITGINNALTANLLTLNGNGSVQLNKYGTGTNTGTAAYSLAVDSTGKIIEVSAAGGGGTLQTVTDAGEITTNNIAIYSTGSAHTIPVNSQNIAVGQTINMTSSTRNIAVGISHTVTGQNNIVGGQLQKMFGKWSLSVGYNNENNGQFGMVIGRNHVLSGTASDTVSFIGIQHTNGVDGTGSLAVGGVCFVNGNFSTAIGYGNQTQGKAGLAVGMFATTNTFGEFAIGTYYPYPNATEILGGNAQTSIVTFGRPHQTVGSFTTLSVTGSRDAAGNGQPGDPKGLPYYQVDANAIYFIQARFIGIAVNGETCVFTLDTYFKNIAGTITAGTLLFTQVLREGAFTGIGNVSLLFAIVTGTTNSMYVKYDNTPSQISRFTVTCIINKLKYIA